MSNREKTQRNRGFTLLLSILVAGIVLAIGLSLLSISLKQFKLGGIGLESEKAFHAANAGVECAKYWDNSSNENAANSGDGAFEVPNANLASINCMGSNGSPCTKAGAGACNTGGGRDSTDEQRFTFDWNNTGSSDDDVCTIISVWKFFDASGPEPMDNAGLDGQTCSTGTECTVIRSLGYNVACGDISSAPRVVEREIFVRY